MISFKTMITFLKVQAASIIGSLIDFLTTILLVEIFHCWYITGNFIGNISGGITQFILCRNWAFKGGEGKIPAQVTKFILVWIGNLILSAAGVYFFTHYLKINYIISKTITSVLLGVTYNYLMQKKFVFVAS
jgi:putative flippase GtrA